MSQGDYKREYNAEDIRRYVAGELSRAEMHAIEKAALDDPFLSDAIEGYGDGIKKEGAESIDLARKQLQYELGERIRESRRNQSPVVVFRRWQVAVAAAVIITTGILGYLAYEDKTNNPVLSANESFKRTIPGAPQAVDSAIQSIAADSANHFKLSDMDSVAIPAPANAQAKTKRDQSADKAEDFTNKAARDEALVEAQNQQETSESERKYIDTRSRKQAEVSIQSDAPVTDTSRDLASTDAGRTKAVVISRATNNEVLNDSFQRTGPPNVVASLEGRAAGVSVTRGRGRGTNAKRPNLFRGRILTPGDQPLSNAVLKNVKTNEAFMTDNNGNFYIPAADSVIQVDVSLVGHQSQRFTLGSNEALNRLVISPDDIQLSEVAVSGYATEKKLSKTNSASDTLYNAAPEGGWQAFAAYIAASKSASLTTIPPLVVELTFSVSRNGKLSDFNIRRSVSPAHDQEAIRLIKNGPKWKVTKGRKAFVRLNVPF
jgi:hypothetical protein